MKKEPGKQAQNLDTADSIELALDLLDPVGEAFDESSGTSQPPKLEKNISFGIIGTTDTISNLDNFGLHTSTGTMHNRVSVSVQAFESGAFNSLSRLSGKDTIPPPIPESLPTTPGYELGGGGLSGTASTSYFDSFHQEQFPLQPQQQTLLTPSDNGGSRLEARKLEGMTLSNPPKNRWRVISIVLWVFCSGMADGAPGALLPTIEEFYGINYPTVSLIWLSNACGYIMIAMVSYKLEGWLGKRKMTAGGCLMQCIMYAFISPGSAYPLVVVGFFFGGVGLAICLSQQNIFLSRFKESSKYLGYYHGSYGLGACIGPLVATAIVNAGVKWHYYYLILLGCMICNFFNQWFAFGGCDEDLKPWDSYDPNSSQSSEYSDVALDSSARTAPVLEEERQLTIIDETVAYTENLRYLNSDPYNGSTSLASLREPDTAEPAIPKGLLKLALKNARTWLLSFFVLFFQGAEAALGGWIITFLIDYRHGNESSIGYVTSGFWGGLAVGRLLLTVHIHRLLGAKRGVTLMLIFSVTIAVLTWVIPIVSLEGVFASLCGMSIGPVYPLMITVAVRVLPRKIQVISLTIMTAFGSSGGALFPFLVGLVSQFRGAFAVMPFSIGLLAGALGIWYCLPNPDRNVVNKIWQRLI